MAPELAFETTGEREQLKNVKIHLLFNHFYLKLHSFYKFILLVLSAHKYIITAKKVGRP